MRACGNPAREQGGKANASSGRGRFAQGLRLRIDALALSRNEGRNLSQQTFARDKILLLNSDLF
jgi:hypothetical protein